MSVASGRWPSAGFVAFCLVLAMAAAFFAWGLRTPPLERVWEIHHLMKIGKLERLDRVDRALLEEQLAAFPELGRDLLDGSEIGLISAHRDGWIAGTRATLLRTPNATAARFLDLDIQAPDEALPLAVVVNGPSWSATREMTGRGPLRVELPPPGAAAEIVEIEIGRPRQGGAAAAPSVRVTWRREP
jgi:hypothetical protein